MFLHQTGFLPETMNSQTTVVWWPWSIHTPCALLPHCEFKEPCY